MKGKLPQVKVSESVTHPIAQRNKIPLQDLKLRKPPTLSIKSEKDMRKTWTSSADGQIRRAVKVLKNARPSFNLAVKNTIDPSGAAVRTAQASGGKKQGKLPSIELGKRRLRE